MGQLRAEAFALTAPAAVVTTGDLGRLRSGCPGQGTKTWTSEEAQYGVLGMNRVADPEAGLLKLCSLKAT